MSDVGNKYKEGYFPNGYLMAYYSASDNSTSGVKGKSFLDKIKEQTIPCARIAYQLGKDVNAQVIIPQNTTVSVDEVVLALIKSAKTKHQVVLFDPANYR